MTSSHPAVCIEALQDPACYAHPVDAVERLETHGNWILLAGEYAYKIKKPVNFGFMDFSTFEQRRFYCEEEVRLNQRLAPELYLRVEPITGTPEAPRMGGDGEAFEYAVMMRRFGHDQRLDAVLERGELVPEAIEQLAADIARFHARAPQAAGDSGYGDPAGLRAMASENFRDCRAHLSDEDQALLSTVEALSDARLEGLVDTLEARRRAGRVRECHGDLHLGNLVLHDGRVQAFDCIEFNADFRWIDTASELAFLSMDCKYRGRPDLAARWIDSYLEVSGDYAAVPLLGFFEAYRAMVRAKVRLLRASQRDNADDAAQDRREARGYIDLARASLEAGRGRILLTMGLSASGKSQLARALVPALPAIRLRSDVERKRLFGLDPLAATGAELGGGIYTAEASERTYGHLAELAGSIASSGSDVIVDATFLEGARREQFRRLADEQGLGFGILCAEAPLEVLEARIRARQQAGNDPSEADATVLRDQRARMDPLSDAERALAVIVDTTQPLDGEALARRIRALPAGLVPAGDGVTGSSGTR